MTCQMMYPSFPPQLSHDGINEGIPSVSLQENKENIDSFYTLQQFSTQFLQLWRSVMLEFTRA